MLEHLLMSKRRGLLSIWDGVMGVSVWQPVSSGGGGGSGLIQIKLPMLWGVLN